jgi:hypothetical protein
MKLRSSRQYRHRRRGHRRHRRSRSIVGKKQTSNVGLEDKRMNKDLGRGDLPCVHRERSLVIVSEDRWSSSLKFVKLNVDGK